MTISRSILLVALASITSLAQSAEAESVIPEPSIFVQQAAQSGLTEIEAGKIALAKSKDPGIRSFAQRMVRDNGKTNLELAALAAEKGIDAPTALDAEHQAVLDDFSRRTGADFDRKYSEHVHSGRAKAVALFEAATNSPDAEVSGFARKGLPALRDQQQWAEKLPGANPKVASPN